MNKEKKNKKNSQDDIALGLMGRAATEIPGWILVLVRISESQAGEMTQPVKSCWTSMRT